MHNKTEGGSGLLVLILTFGVFGILNTEMGVIGMLPLIADTFQVSVPQAGWTGKIRETAGPLLSSARRC